MKTLHFFIYLFSFCCYFSAFIKTQVLSQNQEKIAEFKEALTHATDDSFKVNLLNNLAWEYRSYNLEEMHQHAKEALELAQKIGFLRGQSEATNRIGNYYEALGNYDDAIRFYLSALDIDEQLGDLYGIGRDHHQIATIHANKREYELSIEHELKAIAILEGPPETKKKKLAIASICNSLGNVYKHQGEYKTALEYFHRGLEIREKYNDKKGISKSLNEIGLAYEKMGMFQYALSFHQKSLDRAQSIDYHFGVANSYQNIGNIYFKLYDLDQALTFYEKSLNLKSQLVDVVEYHDLLHNIGILYNQKEEFGLALENLKKSLEVRESTGDKLKIAESYFHIGRVYSNKKDYNQAKKFLQMSLDVTQSMKNPTLHTLILKEFANIYSTQKDSARAFAYYLQATDLSDSLSEQERVAIDYAQKLMESTHNIELLEKDLKLEKSDNEKKTILLYSLLAISALVIIAGILSLFSLRNKHKFKIAEQNAQISRNEIDDLMKTQELKLISAMLEGQDDERNRIAKDLHDRLGGILSIVRLHFKSIEASIHRLGVQNQEQYALATTLLHQACDAVRTISHDIGDTMLLNLGLIPALDDLANTIESSKELQVNLYHHGMKKRLDKKVEIHLFKIIQELLSNILKHAGAKNVSINLIQKADTLTVMVEDDGKGFDINSDEVNEGMGILNIRSRIEEINGKFDIDSQPGYGTTVTLDIPCNS